jgi:hypothetical protein
MIWAIWSWFMFFWEKNLKKKIAFWICILIWLFVMIL